jgi:hypothetical protein
MVNQVSAIDIYDSLRWSTIDMQEIILFNIQVGHKLYIKCDQNHSNDCHDTSHTAKDNLLSNKPAPGANTQADNTQHMQARRADCGRKHHWQ